MKSIKETDMIEYFAHMLDESADREFIRKIPIVIQALIDHFSNDVVRNPGMTYRLSDKDLHSIYNILNANMFDRSLPTNANLCYWPENKIVNMPNEYSIYSGVYDQKYTAAPCYGVHSAICKYILDNHGNIIDVQISDDIIMLNETRLLPCTFIFIVACICHEMIHFYDRLTSAEYHNLALKQSQTGIDEDFHKTKTFIMKQEEANTNGINVIIEYSDNETYRRMNENAFYVLKSVLPEDGDASNTLTASNDRMVFMKSKKTGKGVLTHFD